MALYVPDENGEMINFHTWSARRNAKAKQEQEKSELEKAKEIIKGLLSCCRNYPQENAEKMEQAERFLKEILI